ncbi:MAG: DEAD/DEAH box helicase [Akkermansiaceae bacterium]
MTFASLNLPAPILSAIEQKGYREPTPIQAKAIPFVLKKRDLTGIAQTGTGKTAAFTLPLLSLLGAQKPKAPGIRALIIAPTRELVTQIRDNIHDYSRNISVKLACVYGGVGEKPQIDALRAGAEVVIATPGRLIDLMDQGHLDTRGLEMLVLDEADRMLDMGFLPAVRKIVRKIPNDRQTLLFSATLSGQIEKLTREFQQKPILVEVGARSNPAKTVHQEVYEIMPHLKFDLLLKLLENPELFSVLVFSKMKHAASRLSKRLDKAGISAEAIHGDRSQNQRQRALDKFKAGKLRVLVGTDVAARGIDISGVTHVINYDFPMQNEDYIHRIGRTGRAGAEGDAYTFVSPGDHKALRDLERFMKRDIPRKHLRDFDYDVPAPVRDEQPRGRRNQKQGGGGSRDRRSQPRKMGKKAAGKSARRRGR